MSKHFKRVLYSTDWENGYSIIEDNMLGDGMENIERCDDFWPLIDKKEIDIVCYPDVQNSGEQLHIESLGIPVWGSRAADRIEWDRELFKAKQKELGLPQPVYRSITGIPNLRAYLKEHDNCYIKFSKYRGEMETRRHINYALSEQWLDWIEFRMSPVKHIVKFMVEDELKTDVESGMDAYCVDGKFPDTVIQAIEIKDCGSMGTVTPYKDMPSQLIEPMEAFAPYLKANRYRNQISTENRIKKGVGYYTDATQRMASPCGEAFLANCENIGDIAWRGAHGELVQPKFASKFVCQAIIFHKEEKLDMFRPLQIPDEVKPFVALYRVCEMEDAYQIVPQSPHFKEVGSVIGLGDTMESAIDNLKKHAEAIKNNHIEVNTDSLYYAIKEIHSAEKQGVEFTPDKVPQPDVALT